MSRKKEHLEKRLENKRQLEAKLKKYSPGTGIDKRKDVDLYRIDLEEGLVYVRINPSASREAIYLQLDKELTERWPPLHKKKMELTHEQRNSLEEGMRDFIREVKASGLLAPQKLKAIESDYWDAWTGRRSRVERLRALEVYRLRAIGKVEQFPVYTGSEKNPGEYRQTVKKKSFIEIGTELGISSDTARKSFSTAYKLIHGTSYRKDVKIEVQKALLKKECGTCKDRPSCKELCPDALSFVDQGTVKRDEHYSNIRKLQGK